MHGLCCTCAQVRRGPANRLALLKWLQAHAYRHCELLFLRHSLNWQTYLLQSLDLSTSTKASTL